MQETIEKRDAKGVLLPEMVRSSPFRNWLAARCHRCSTAGDTVNPDHQYTYGRCYQPANGRPSCPLCLSGGRVHSSSSVCTQILICQNLRNNLQHPNEYIRGVTLRFLCRIHEEEILEPLTPSILANLEHRHSFVRRNAVLCLNEMYKLPKGDLLLQDAPELVESFLSREQDMSSRRNAFMFLANHDPDRAVEYLTAQADKIIDWSAILQMSVLDLIRKVRTKQTNK